jgi:hypothetical protein
MYWASPKLHELALKYQNDRWQRAEANCEIFLKPIFNFNFDSAVLFCQLSILSTCCFFNMMLHQCDCINVLFHELAVSSTCCFICMFNQLAVL